MSRYSRAAQKAIANKMGKISDERDERPRKQQIAIALSEARRKGLKVPKKKD